MSRRLEARLPSCRERSPASSLASPRSHVSFTFLAYSDDIPMTFLRDYSYYIPTTFLPYSYNITQYLQGRHQHRAAAAVTCCTRPAEPGYMLGTSFSRADHTNKVVNTKYRTDPSAPCTVPVALSLVMSLTSAHSTATSAVMQLNPRRLTSVKFVVLIRVVCELFLRATPCK